LKAEPCTYTDNNFDNTSVLLSTRHLASSINWFKKVGLLVVVTESVRKQYNLEQFYIWRVCEHELNIVNPRGGKRTLTNVKLDRIMYTCVNANQYSNVDI